MPKHYHGCPLSDLTTFKAASNPELYAPWTFEKNLVCVCYPIINNLSSMGVDKVKKC